LKTTPFNSTYTGNWPFSNECELSDSGHAPAITKFVVGITLADSDAGKPEKTVFNKGDWKRMVHTAKNGGKSYDLSWDFPDKFIGGANIGTRARSH
jgi:hypothetical protein